MQNPKAIIDRDGDTYIVRAHWDGVDRPNTYGISTGRSIMLAQRTARAIEAGAALPNPTITTDVNGQTYVAHGLAIMGRRLNADLKRLGF